jgi:hypothetical protein
VTSSSKDSNAPGRSICGGIVKAQSTRRQVPGSNNVSNLPPPLIPMVLVTSGYAQQMQELCGLSPGLTNCQITQSMAIKARMIYRWHKHFYSSHISNVLITSNASATLYQQQTASNLPFSNPLVRVHSSPSAQSWELSCRHHLSWLQRLPSTGLRTGTICSHR